MHIDDPIAVIDIGSNSIRLYVTGRRRRNPIPLFQEKIFCGLGRDLNTTGLISEEAKAIAHQNLDRFIAICRAYGVQQPFIIATEALRAAKNGDAFIRQIQADFNVQVRLLSGDEEAKISSYGVIASYLDPDGIVADMGGGSLELTWVEGAQPKAWTSMPLGGLRLQNFPSHAALTDHIGTTLQGCDWLGQLPKKPLNLFVVGGWRALGYMLMQQNDYPISVVDGYRVTPRDMQRLAQKMRHMTADDFMAYHTAVQRRRDTLPKAIEVMDVLLGHITAQTDCAIIFSSFGLREGYSFLSFDNKTQAKDALIDQCLEYARSTNRFPLNNPHALMMWVEPALPAISVLDRRLCWAACLLADIGWMDYGDERGINAYYRVLNMPLVGLEAWQRVFLAACVYIRYEGQIRPSLRGVSMLTRDYMALATRLGLALRLAEALCAGDLKLLEGMHLRKDAAGALTLEADDARHEPFLKGIVIEQRLRALFS